MKTSKIQDCELQSTAIQGTACVCAEDSRLCQHRVSYMSLTKHLQSFTLLPMKCPLCTGFSWYRLSNDLGLLRLCSQSATTLKVKHCKGQTCSPRALGGSGKTITAAHVFKVSLQESKTASALFSVEVKM